MVTAACCPVLARWIKAASKHLAAPIRGYVRAATMDRSHIK
jgi:hypothetical protein